MEIRLLKLKKKIAMKVELTELLYYIIYLEFFWLKYFSKSLVIVISSCTLRINTQENSELFTLIIRNIQLDNAMTRDIEKYINQKNFNSRLL